MRYTSIALLAVATLATVAGAQTRTGGSGIAVTKDRGTSATVSTTPSTTTTTVVSGGDVSLTTPFDISAYGPNMNEKNIAAHMAAGDSLEIQLAELALNKATSQAVRDYATTLLNDHRAHLAKTNELIVKESIGAEPMAFDPEGMRMRQMLTGLRNLSAGMNWDAAFLRFQAQHHQNEIDILNSSIKNAHDDDFEDHIEDTLKSLANHRDMARSAATSLNIQL